MVWSLQSTVDISEAQFTRWSELLEQHAGIFLSETQKTFLQTQIAMRMRELEIDSYDDYYALVTDGVVGMIEWTQLVDRLVVKETSFFRHPPSIDFVSERAKQHISRGAPAGSFEVWSVGCSSGEEPYSLAMVLDESFRSSPNKCHFSIHATDISRVALATARAAIYTDRKLERVTERYVERCIEKVELGQNQVVGALRERICFTQGNILKVDEMPMVKWDVIFCQNLLVYFRRWRREEIMNAFAERLKPGGVIVVGLGEVVDWQHPNISRIANNDLQAYVYE